MYLSSPLAATPHTIETIEDYEHMLKGFDWYYEYSDDHRVWKKGSEGMRLLRDAQSRLDPSKTLWNTHCPYRAVS